MLEVARARRLPLVLEAWRECLHDAFELDALRERLLEIADRCDHGPPPTTDRRPPFAEQVAWTETNRPDVLRRRPAGDARAACAGPCARARLLLAPAAPHRARSSDELEESSSDRPRLRSSRRAELLEWAKERRVIPATSGAPCCRRCGATTSWTRRRTRRPDRLAASGPGSAARRWSARSKPCPRSRPALAVRSTAGAGVGGARRRRRGRGRRRARPRCSAPRPSRCPTRSLAELLGDCWPLRPGRPAWIAATLEVDARGRHRPRRAGRGGRPSCSTRSRGRDRGRGLRPREPGAPAAHDRSAARPSFRPLRRSCSRSGSPTTRASAGARPPSTTSRRARATPRPARCRRPRRDRDPAARVQPYHPSVARRAACPNRARVVSAAASAGSPSFPGDRDLRQSLLRRAATMTMHGRSATCCRRARTVQLTDLLRRSGSGLRRAPRGPVDAGVAGARRRRQLRPLRQGSPPASQRPPAARSAGRAPAGHLDRWRSRLPVTGTGSDWRRPSPPRRPRAEEADRERRACSSTATACCSGSSSSASCRPCAGGRSPGRCAMLELAGESSPAASSDAVPGLQSWRGPPSTASRRACRGPRWWLNAGTRRRPAASGDRPRVPAAAAGGVEHVRLPRPPAGADLGAARRPPDHRSRPRPPGCPTTSASCAPSSPIGATAFRDHGRRDQQPAGRREPYRSALQEAFQVTEPDRAQAFAAVLRSRVGHRPHARS